MDNNSCILFENYMAYYFKTMLYYCMLIRKLVVNNLMYLLYLLQTICCICMIHLFVNLWSLFDLLWCIIVCDCCFRRRCALYNGASGDGTFLTLANSLQFSASGGGKFAATREYVYSALAAMYTAPKFSAAVEDALTHSIYIASYTPSIVCLRFIDYRFVATSPHLGIILVQYGLIILAPPILAFPCATSGVQIVRCKDFLETR
jgi:hypothetical protein